MRKPAETVDSFVIAECGRISRDPNETPERRRVAAEWGRKLLHGTGQNWEGNGHTVAEREGIVVDPKAPGGQRVSGGAGKQGRVDRSGVDIDSGELSNEISSEQRQGHWHIRNFA